MRRDEPKVVVTTRELEGDGTYRKSVRTNDRTLKRDQISEAWFVPEESCRQRVMPDGSVVTERQTVEVVEGEWENWEEERFVFARRFWCDTTEKWWVHFQVIQYFRRDDYE